MHCRWAQSTIRDQSHGSQSWCRGRFHQTRLAKRAIRECCRVSATSQIKTKHPSVTSKLFCTGFQIRRFSMPCTRTTSELTQPLITSRTSEFFIDKLKKIVPVFLLITRHVWLFDVGSNLSLYLEKHSWIFLKCFKLKI